MEDVHHSIESVARALCNEDFAKVPEPARSQYVEDQWINYLSRAEAAITAFTFSLAKKGKR